MSANKKLWRVGLLAASFLAVLVLNPAYLTGCVTTTNSAKYRFTEAELASLVEGVYTGQVLLDDGGKGQLTLTIKQSSSAYEPFAMWRLGELPVQSAMACGERTLVKGAAACISTTRMPLTGTVTLSKLDEQGQPSTVVLDGVALRGEAFVGGETLTNAEITAAWSKEERVVLRSEDGKGFTNEGAWLRPSGVSSKVSDLTKNAL